MCKFVLERGLQPHLLPADYIMFAMFSTRRYNLSESFVIPSGSIPYDSLRYSLFMMSASHVPTPYALQTHGPTHAVSCCAALQSSIVVCATRCRRWRMARTR